MQLTTQESRNKIFVGGLSPITTIENLKKHFSQFGDLVDCVIMQDKNTGKYRGFGFVTFKSLDAVDVVLANQHVLDGKPVDCKRAFPRDKRTGPEQPKKADSGHSFKTRKIFVGGLPHTITEELFNKYFGQFGLVESSSIMCDRTTGKARGFGFVIFVHEEAVERVIQNYERNYIDGKWVECKRAIPKAKIQETNMSPLNLDSFGAYSEFIYTKTPVLLSETKSISFDSYENESKFNGFAPENEFEIQPNFFYQFGKNPNSNALQKENIVQRVTGPSLRVAPKRSPVLSQISTDFFNWEHPKASCQEIDSKAHGQHPQFPIQGTYKLKSPEIVSHEQFETKFEFGQSKPLIKLEDEPLVQDNKLKIEQSYEPFQYFGYQLPENKFLPAPVNRASWEPDYQACPISFNSEFRASSYPIDVLSQNGEQLFSDARNGSLFGTFN